MPLAGRIVQTLREVGAIATISADGTTVAHVVGETIVVLDLASGAERGRIPLRTTLYDLALSTDGAELFYAGKDLLARHAVATGELLAHRASNIHELQLGPGGDRLVCERRVLRITDLSEIDDDGLTRFAPCNEHFELQGIEDAPDEGVAGYLFDRERARYVARYGRYDRWVTSLARGRIAIIGDGATRLLDLVTLETVELGPGTPIAASAAGDRVVLRSGDAERIVEVAWSWDDDGAPDPLAAAFDVDEPPIVAQLLPELASGRLDVLEETVRHHPRLELALARRLPAAKAYELTRTALVAPWIAARPDAWAQLASLALELGLLPEAADACAEGLARDEDHAELHALLARARPRGPQATLALAHEWVTEAQMATHLAADGAGFATATVVWERDGVTTVVQRWERDGRERSRTEIPDAAKAIAFDGAGRIALVFEGAAVYGPLDSTDRERLSYGADAVALALGLEGPPVVRLQNGVVVFRGEEIDNEWRTDHALAVFGANAVVASDTRLLVSDGRRSTILVDSGVKSLARSATQLVAGSRDSTVRRWDHALVALPSLVGPPNTRFVACSRTLVAAAGKGVLRVWRDGAAYPDLAVGNVLGIACTDDGVATIDHTGRVRVYR